MPKLNLKVLPKDPHQPISGNTCPHRERCNKAAGLKAEYWKREALRERRNFSIMLKAFQNLIRSAMVIKK
jgi:hypothetical protein